MKKTIKNKAARILKTDVSRRLRGCWIKPSSSVIPGPAEHAEALPALARLSSTSASPCFLTYVIYIVNLHSLHRQIWNNCIVLDVCLSTRRSPSRFGSLSTSGNTGCLLTLADAISLFYYLFLSHINNTKQMSRELWLQGIWSKR